MDYKFLGCMLGPRPVYGFPSLSVCTSVPALLSTTSADAEDLVALASDFRMSTLLWLFWTRLNHLLSRWLEARAPARNPLRIDNPYIYPIIIQ